MSDKRSARTYADTSMQAIDTQMMGDHAARTHYMHDQRTLKTTLTGATLLMGLDTVLFLLISFRDAPLSSNVTMLIVVLCVGLAGWMLWRDKVSQAAHVLLAGLLLAGFAGMYFYGSVRSASNVLNAAAVVLAAVLMSAQALALTLAIAVASVTLATVLEAGGLLWQASPDFSANGYFWLTQSTSLMVIAALVYFARHNGQRVWRQRLRAMRERSTAEQQRDRNLRRFERIFQMTPTPIMVQSAQTGSILNVNAAFEKEYGYRRDELFGRSDEFIWADGAAHAQYTRRLLGNKEVLGHHMTSRRSDGSCAEVLISSRFSRRGGQSLRITSITVLPPQTPASN